MRPILGSSHWGRESSFVTRPSSSGGLLLVGDMGWMVHWVCRGRHTVCDPPSVSPVLSHCIPRIAEYVQAIKGSLVN